jgi:hypothetical protein
MKHSGVSIFERRNTNHDFISIMTSYRVDGRIDSVRQMVGKVRIGTRQADNCIAALEDAHFSHLNEYNAIKP